VPAQVRLSAIALLAAVYAEQKAQHRVFLHSTLLERIATLPPTHSTMEGVIREVRARALGATGRRAEARSSQELASIMSDPKFNAAEFLDRPLSEAQKARCADSAPSCVVRKRWVHADT
jgi:hypothetical protein